MNKVMLKSGWDTLRIHYMVANIKWMLEIVEANCTTFLQGCKCSPFFIKLYFLNSCIKFGGYNMDLTVEKEKVNVYNSCLESARKRHFYIKWLGSSETNTESSVWAEFWKKSGKSHYMRKSHITFQALTKYQQPHWERKKVGSRVTNIPGLLGTALGNPTLLGKQRGLVNRCGWRIQWKTEKLNWRHRWEVVKYLFFCLTLF